jgi:hypothetical protein
MIVQWFDNVRTAAKLTLTLGVVLLLALSVGTAVHGADASYIG